MRTRGGGGVLSGEPRGIFRAQKEKNNNLAQSPLINALVHKVEDKMAAPQVFTPEIPTSIRRE